MGYQMIIMFVVMAGLIFYMNRTQKKQAAKRMELLMKWILKNGPLFWMLMAFI